MLKLIKYLIFFCFIVIPLYNVKEVFAECSLESEVCAPDFGSCTPYCGPCCWSEHDFERVECLGCPEPNTTKIQFYYCDPPNDGDELCSSCFTGETRIDNSKGNCQIKDLKIGDDVTSQDPQTGENTTSLVEKIHEVTRSAYYKITLKDGKEVNVTGEHPLYAIQQSVKPITFWEYLKSESLTRKAVDYIASKFQ